MRRAVRELMVGSAALTGLGLWIALFIWVIWAGGAFADCGTEMTVEGVAPTCPELDGD